MSSQCECLGKDGKVLTDKKGNPDTRLIPLLKHQVNVRYLLRFIGALLPEIIHHRNAETVQINK